MSEHISNLLVGTVEGVYSSQYMAISYETTEPLVIGNTYTISAYVEDIECDGAETPRLDVYDGGGWWHAGKLIGNVPGTQTLTFTYVQPVPDHADPNHIRIYNTSDYDISKKRKSVFHNIMLVKGTEPAAWAPADGETLTADAGGVLS